jgi:hypothetical protein
MSPTRLTTLTATACFTMTVLAGTPAAQAGGDGPSRFGFVPHIEGEISVELQSDHVVRSDDPAGKISDTYTTTEAELTTHLTPTFAVVSHFVLEPVRDPMDDRFFDDHGAYIEEIYARFKFGAVTVKAGKYDPAFGTAWDVAPGVYGTDFAEDYELVERLGLAIVYGQSGTVFGDVTLTASVFKLDTTELSRSIFTDRGRMTREAGGASNTGGLESFALAAKFANVAKSGVTFNFGYRNQAEGDGPDDVTNEQGFVVGLSGEHKTSDGKIEWIVEAATFDNFNAGVTDVTFVTAGLKWTFLKHYNIALSGTRRQIDNPTASDFTDHLFQVSAGTELGAGWSFDVGYKWEEIEGVKSQTVGVLLARKFTINTAMATPIK